MANKANISGGAFTGSVVAPSLDVNATTTSPSMNMLSNSVLIGRVTGVLEEPNSSMRIRVYRGSTIFDYRFHPTELIPPSDGAVSIGSSTNRLRDIYAVNSPIIGSDQRIKKDISPLDISLITKLLMSIQAVQYRLIDGDSGRFHYGFLAQDVENALTKAELTSMDFAGFIKSPALDEDGKETSDYIYALRLEEFIPILWAHQQDIERRLRALEAAQ